MRPNFIVPAILLTLTYAFGAPMFDDVRPEAIDMPLRYFHQDVGLAAAKGARLARETDPIEAIGNFSYKRDVGGLDQFLVSSASW